jgi:hypothetical protein
MKKSTLLVFLLAIIQLSFAQKKKSENGSFLFLEAEMFYVETSFDFDKKAHTFKTRTQTSSSMRKFDENLSGTYIRKGEALILDFELTKNPVNPFLNCRELSEGEKKFTCRDTLIFRNDSVFSKDRQLAAPRKKP